MLEFESFLDEGCGVGEVSLSCLVSAVVVEKGRSMAEGREGVYKTKPGVDI